MAGDGLRETPGYPTICEWCKQPVWTPETWSLHAYGICVDRAGAGGREAAAETLITRAKT